MSYTVDMLNTIRNGASTEYQERIPQATRDNITAVGNAILSYTLTMNEFATALINKIGLTILSSKMAKNKLAKFKKGMLPYGKDVEEVFIEMAKSEGSYDPTGANPLGRRLPDIKTIYHRQNRQDKYVKSITKAQLKSAFTSENGLQDLLSGIVNSIYSGSNYDEFVLMKQLLGAYEANYFDYGVPAIVDEASAKEFVKTVRKAVNDLSFMSSTYNKAGVMTNSEVKDLVLLVNKDVIAEVDVEVLAKAFNMGKTDFEPEIITLDDFGGMLNTYGLLVDKDFFKVFDTLNEAAEQFNADGLFTNHFFHIWQIMSTSQFKNAVRFTTVPKV
jgi:hypothetical protein